MYDQQILIKTLGQYLYQNIKQAWLTAEIMLEYKDDITHCSANFIAENENVAAIEIPANIQQSYERLCDHAKTNSPENWQRAIFSIERSGNYSLNFELDPVFDLE